ncbi:MAG: radical SAM protein [Nanoarchaeota archaeon]
MRIAIVYPPFTKGKEYPLLGQNRQFRYSNSKEVRIFPLIPATAATILKEAGHEVLFLDGINQRLTKKEFIQKLTDFKPDLIALETKAPVIKIHWNFINKTKERTKAKFALFGDHVSYFPEESFKNSKVDYIIVGGDYDVGLQKLTESIEKNKKMPEGIWYKNKKIIPNGRLQNIKNLDKIPFIDRELTNWDLYGEAYLYQPCAYILTGRGCGSEDCGARGCTFCIWQHALWNKTARLRSPENVAEEIRILVAKYKIKEIFDDNEGGAVWSTKWLKEFHIAMEQRNLIGKVKISTNARADSLTEENCKLMKKIGFRLLKVGLESGNNKTLKLINKQETVQDIIKGVKTAKDHGLIVMLTSMVGYPWETEEDVARTYKVAKELMLYKTHLGDSLQSSVIMPYPGTPLYNQSLKNKWFLKDPKNYEIFNQTQAILKSPIDTQKWCKKMWSIHSNPVFMTKTLLSIRTKRDITFLARGLKSVIGHLRDY